MEEIEGQRGGLGTGKIEEVGKGGGRHVGGNAKRERGRIGT